MDEDLMIQLIDEIPTMSEAIRCCIRVARLTDKQVYLEMGIDGGHWMRMTRGLANFPHEKFIELMNICGNDIPLQWLAKNRGYELKATDASLEEQLKKEKAEKIELQNKLNIITEVLKKANFPVT